MKDMFYNYDHNINKKEYPKLDSWGGETKMLEGNNNTYIITDIKGNEIGVEVKRDVGFTLYFTLDGEVEGSSISELVDNSTILFEIIDRTHEVVLSYKPDVVDYDLITNTMAIEISAKQASILKLESYRMRLTLNWPDGSYRLVDEDAGLLIVR